MREAEGGRSWLEASLGKVSERAYLKQNQTKTNNQTKTLKAKRLSVDQVVKHLLSKY
jgi:hypothetical protein